MTFLILLLAAHLIGDFLLQPSAWVRSKFEKGIASSGFWKHIGVHAILLIIIGFLYPEFYFALFFVILGHTLIDAGKIYFLQNSTNVKRRIWAFLLDQLAHVLLIVLISSQTSLYFDFTYFLQADFLLICTGILFITLPSSALIKVLLSPYAHVIEMAENEDKKDSWRDLILQNEGPIEVQKSLKNAGQYIGIIERILVFTFILIGQWSAVGFLITAKSVFRFGDLNHGKNRQFTEYVLIGTLLSFGIAIGSAILIEFILTQM
ncbi:MAG: DUF3307 domain-containing protein [Flavobacteriaceae bacterium]|nr:DUF3307 domain-containing protein [Flavobacteriaceae bacterium]